MDFITKMKKGAKDTQEGVTKGLNKGNEIVNTLNEQVKYGTQAYKDEIMKKNYALQAQIQNTIPKGNFPLTRVGGKSRKRRKRRRKRKTKRRGKSKNKRTRKHKKKRKRKRGGKSRRRK
tara:strand:- start:684 stop:1040 length:357 start_codon:yes stop_codon:yes gene_type:complete